MESRAYLMQALGLSSRRRQAPAPSNRPVRCSFQGVVQRRCINPSRYKHQLCPSQVRWAGKGRGGKDTTEPLWGFSKRFAQAVTATLRMLRRCERKPGQVL